MLTSDPFSICLAILTAEEMNEHSVTMGWVASSMNAQQVGISIQFPSPNRKRATAYPSGLLTTAFVCLCDFVKILSL